MSYLKGKKMKKDFIEYDPVAGMTILAAIEEAVNLAKKHDKKVKAEINDIKMTFSKKTDPKVALKRFRRRLADRFEKLIAEQAKRQKN